jgi:hypothetical protein
MTLNKAALSAVLFVSAGAVAQAQVIYDNFAAGNGYNGGTGWTISGAGSVLGADNDQGEQFMAGASGAVQTLDIAMGHVTGTPSVTMRLYNDAGGVLGAQNGSAATFAVNPNSFGAGTEYISVNVLAAGWNVTSGNMYWLIADSANDAWLAWNQNSTSTTGNHYFNGSYSSGALHGAYRLTAVPEPATMIALGAGLAALAARRRRK